ncbi:MAG TPA: 30S ribosomal protein S19 [Candidatus Nanoarchaeia archaeon]|nr:30S ribosomal protein S19 [Candidatus Nanoarchaeia archaeon]
MAKIFTWQGRTEDEIKQLEIDEFIKLIPARPRRSLKRGFTAPQKSLLKRIEAGDNNIKTHCRNMIIVPKMIGKTLRVYNGREFLPIVITVDMIGHTLGEFSHTRRTVTHSAAGIGATRSSKAVSAR